MILAAYIAFALIAGSVAGTSLGYLLNAPRKKASELRQWFAFLAAMVVVIGCAVVMRNASDLNNLSIFTKFSAAAAFVLSFVAAMIRCRVKL